MRDYGQDLILFLACVLMSFALGSAIWSLASLIIRFGVPK